MKNKKMVLPLIALVLITMLACQILPAKINFNLPKVNVPTLQAPVPTLALPQSGEQNLEQNQNLLTSLYQQVSPGVVAIQTATQDGAGLGSGFVYNKEGYIVTNFHVVDGAETLEVDFPSGLKVRGKVVGSDTDSDIAVVKVDVPADQLTPMLLGDSDQLQVGQMVVAIGNPFGLSGTMTLGIISAKGRNLESLRTTDGGRPFSAGDVIQTDASINPGNSGGPLLNLQGQVVGVNRAIRTTGATSNGEPVNSGIGFAVSINIVKKVVPVLISSGKYDYPYLGISSVDEVSLAMQEALGLPQSTGAYLVEVVSGGPADQAGLRAGSRDTNVDGLFAGGDLIIAADDQPVRVYADLIGYLMTHKTPGDQTVLTIIRDGKQQQVTVTLGKRP